ncbi:MAG: hypothetical protein EOM59_10280 [Clostridia bacterium]|nr:hypothetical protein [Clostridia bacterium]
MNPNIYSENMPETRYNKVGLSAILVGVYCMLVPIENVMSVIPGRSLNRYVGMLIILWELLLIIRNKTNIIGYLKKGLPFLVFLALAVLSVCWCTWYYEWKSATSILLNNTVLLIIIINRHYSAKEQTVIQLLCGIMGIILSLSIVAGTELSLVNVGRYTISINGARVDQNNLALSLTIPFFCIVSYMATHSTKKALKFILYLSLSLIIYTIFLSGSRSGLLGLCLGGVVALWLFSKKSLSKKLKVAGMLILAYGLFLLILSNLPSSIADRFSVANVLENGASNRFTIWINDLAIHKNYSFLQQLFGCGYGNSFNLYYKYYGAYVGAHNDFIQMMIELGIVGLCSYLYILLYVLVKAIKSGNPIALAMITSAIVGACSMEMLIKKMFWIMVFFALILKKNVVSDDCKVKNKIVKDVSGQKYTSKYIRR